MRKVRACFFIAMITAMIFGLWGCASNPVDAPDTAPGTVSTSYLITGDLVQYTGVVASIDADNRILTCTGIAYPVVVPVDCDISLIEQGLETPMALEDIAVGTEVKVCGVYQDDGTILASRIRMCIPYVCPTYDVEFRDEITAIDYAAGTITVAGRGETIVVDENTTIWGVTPHYMGDPDAETETMPTDGGWLKANPDHYIGWHHIALALTDLKVGDVIEVRANTVDAATLLAVSIKLANCTDASCRCVEFTAALATIDCAERLVTFDGSDWSGYVCPDAELLDAAGAALTLCDFAVGEAVAVKGFPLEDGTLQICLMVRQ